MLFNGGIVVQADRELMVLANTWVIELNIKGAIVLCNTEMVILAKRGVTLQYKSEWRRLSTEQMAESTYVSSG
jgi:hypothetical protein